MSNFDAVMACTRELIHRKREQAAGQSSRSARKARNIDIKWIYLKFWRARARDRHCRFLAIHAARVRQFLPLLTVSARDSTRHYLPCAEKSAE
jgi:hypothetical protein